MTDTELQQKRLIAAAIDGGIAVGLIAVTYIGAMVAALIWYRLSHIAMFVGYVVVLAYVLGRDVIGGNRSLGKMTQEIKVVTTSGAPLTLVDSVKRNAIFGIGAALVLVYTLLSFVPFLACVAAPLLWVGWLANVVAVILEIVKIMQDPAGVRLGDQLASTRVTR
jgi:hypothetical protein